MWSKNEVRQIRKHYYAMLKEVDELVGQVVKAIPVRKRQEIKFKQSEISERSKMSLNTDLSVVYQLWRFSLISNER